MEGVLILAALIILIAWCDLDILGERWRDDD